MGPILAAAVAAAGATCGACFGWMKLRERSRTRVRLAEIDAEQSALEMLKGEINRLQTRVRELETWRDAAEAAHRAELAALRDEKHRIAGEAQAAVLKAELYRLQVETLKVENDRLRSMLPPQHSPLITP